eukprot:1979286-Amphidinium_carterae.1
MRMMTIQVTTLLQATWARKRKTKHCTKNNKARDEERPTPHPSPRVRGLLYNQTCRILDSSISLRFLLGRLSSIP